MDFFSLNAIEYDKSSYKNSLFARSSAKCVALLQGTVTNQAEIESVLSDNTFLEDMDVVVFGENIPGGEIGLADALCMLDSSYYAIVIKKDILQQTGCFNERICSGSNYEFLCRVASAGRVYCIPCSAEPNQDSGCQTERIAAKTGAYVLRRYMSWLKNQGLLEDVFHRMTNYMSIQGQQDFEKELSGFLNDEKQYEHVAMNTAPFFVISGDATCVGVLRDFADSLADELARMGQAVITTNRRYGDYEGMESISNLLIKAYVGFQIPALESDFFRRKSGKKIQFWFDNPLFFDNRFHELDDNYYLLCQDAGYAKHLKTYYGVKNAMQFPPAGRELGVSGQGDHERPYEVVFIGGFNKLEELEFENDEQRNFYGYMMEHPSMTFEEGYREYLLSKNNSVSEDSFLKDLQYMKPVCARVINVYRKRVVDTILESGIPLHVYGDSWKAYDGAGRENLIIHPEVSVEESLEILSKSKVGLNIMTWHKSGMTERVANIMLSGAVCVSDETTYLQQNFNEDKEIVLFSLEHLEDLPIKIKSLLENEDSRSSIAANAYKKASEKHLWRNRAKDLISLVDE